MNVFYNLHNMFQVLLEKSRKHIYLVLPGISALFYFCFKDKVFNGTLDNLESYSNNVINLSGVLAGFLFTTFGTFMSLPDNKFLDALETTGYFKSIYTVQLLGIIFLLLSMLIGLFNLSIKCMTIFFIFGISEALGSLYYYYRILALSKKSNTKY